MCVFLFFNQIKLVLKPFSSTKHFKKILKYVSLITILVTWNIAALTGLVMVQCCTSCSFVACIITISSFCESHSYSTSYSWFHIIYNTNVAELSLYIENKIMYVIPTNSFTLAKLQLRTNQQKIMLSKSYSSFVFSTIDSNMPSRELWPAWTCILECMNAWTKQWRHKG